jgi:hypothetical protein
VTLTVTDVNEAAPVFSSGTAASAAENVADTAVLYTAVATDADATASLTYSLSDDAGGLFEINAGTGAVSLAAGQSLDREAAASHAFTVVASDGVNTASRTVTLTVTDVNEAPTGVSFANQIALAENSTIGSGVKVADILITDDALGTETLSLSGADAASFEVRNGSELYFIGSSPNFETKASWILARRFARLYSEHHGRQRGPDGREPQQPFAGREYDDRIRRKGRGHPHCGRCAWERDGQHRNGAVFRRHFAELRGEIILRHHPRRGGCKRRSEPGRVASLHYQRH